MTWSAAAYPRFAAGRTQPAQDRITRPPVRADGRVIPLFPRLFLVAGHDGGTGFPKPP